MYNFSKVTNLLTEVEAISALSELFNYDRLTGTLTWNHHPTQPHLQGRPVGTSRGRIKFNRRYYSIARLIWSLVEGKVCTYPYVLFRDGDINNMIYKNIYPSHRSVTPTNAAVADKKTSKMFKGQVYEALDETDPSALFAAGLAAVQEGIEAISGETPSAAFLEEESLHLFNQELENVKNKLS